MLAYKKLLVIDTPWNKLVLSPTRGTPWKLENGFYTLRCDDVPDWTPAPSIAKGIMISYNGTTAKADIPMPRIMPSGIYTCKSPDDREMMGYAGNLFEVAIGGTVVEHERGYRSSVACAVRCIEEYAVFPEYIAQALYGMGNSDFLEIGRDNAYWLLREAMTARYIGRDSYDHAMRQAEYNIKVAFEYPVKFEYGWSTKWT